MSTKTIKQRIAQVAVMALSAGFISVVVAPAANATAFDSATAAGYVQIATVADTDGTPDVSSGIASTSVGWIVDTSSTAASTNSTTIIASGGLSKTGNILAGAKLGIMASNTSSANLSIVVTGGSLSSVSVSTGSTLLNGSSTTAVATAATAIAADNITLGAVFSVTAAAGSTATIAAYSGASNTITSTSTATGGSLLGLWTLTVVAASASGTLSVADSYAVQQACIDAGATTAGTTTTYDTTTKCTNGQVGQIYVDLYDAYSARVTGGALAASTTAGYVNVVNSASVTAANTYQATAAFDSETINASGANYILVTQPTANTAGSATVTITYKGAVVATKTISWTGVAASIVVDPANTAKSFYAGAVDTSTTYLNNVIYVVKDAAGNAITTTTNPTVANATGSMVGSTLSTSATSATVYANATQTSSRGYGVTTMLVPSATANKGAGTYQLKFVNSAGTAIYSQTMNATVSNGATASFAASWDKASYVPGDIATLTITVKDEYGNLMATGHPLGGLTDNLIVASGFTAVGGSCTSSSTVTDGVKTCKYSAGNTAGSYSWSVDLTTSPANQSAVVGTLKITDSAVSNADVLKSIVALIASINKQIQALQKLILKR
jgi:hypothetical protein